MYKDFRNFDELISQVKEDKYATGAGAITANRYPIRFVLFDNFRDAYKFVSYMQQNAGANVYSVNSWLDKDYDDIIITHGLLSEELCSHVKSNVKHDSVIAPFSELARFYDNSKEFQFNALVSTIKAIESTIDGFNVNQRIYIPIVGLEGKMSKFEQDSQAYIWYFKSTDRQLNYRLILTNNTIYGLRNLDNNYTIVSTVRQWLNLWKNMDAKSNIISMSPAIFANAKHAQPDNAFSFCTCNNAFEFLTTGLGLSFESISCNPDDMPHWERLAKEIDYNNFSFDVFFNSYFQIYNLADYNVFLNTWIGCKDEFEKWLLKTYYVNKFCDKGYICQVVKAIKSYKNQDFFTSALLAIFTLDNPEQYIKERETCLLMALKEHIVITQESQLKLKSFLESTSIEKSHLTAIKYFSPLTNIEKYLAIDWLRQGYIQKDNLQTVYPDLYAYLSVNHDFHEAKFQWISKYMEEYRNAKITNSYSDSIVSIINDKNKSSVTFNSWYQDFKTVDTLLCGRKDIDVIYWIDGLGIDWIPYIKWLIGNKNSDNIFLNEIHIARAKLPTTTKVNKQILEKLSDSKLLKKGNLDEFAHGVTNIYPTLIIEEIKIVKKAISDILNGYADKKVAIVSDHGLTALSQLCQGLNMSGVKSDHHGRIAIRDEELLIISDDYFTLDDNKTLCALKHKSLCGKVHSGQSVHGGCTPEEVLVPILIISSDNIATGWTVNLISEEISATNPIVQFKIKGLTSADTLYAISDGKQYSVNKKDVDIYETGRINFTRQNEIITVYINNNAYRFDLNVSLGAEMNDLF